MHVSPLTKQEDSVLKATAFVSSRHLHDLYRFLDFYMCMISLLLDGDAHGGAL